jgi:tetratricopeptide (TPR) repeat protein
LASFESNREVGTNARSNDLYIAAAGFKLPFYSKKVDQDARLYRPKPTPVPLLLLFLLISIAAMPQLNRGSERMLIHGQITDVQGEPVALATVELRDLHGVEMGTSLTDTTGSFAISTRTEPGDYILLAAKRRQVSDERITLDQPDVEVKIELPTGATLVASEGREDYAVSVQQLRTPEKVQMYLKLANQQFAKLNFAGAEREVERALQADRSCAAAFSMRAFLSIASRNLNGAIDDAKRAALLDPYDAEAYLAEATAYNSLTRFQDAEEASRQALRLRPDLWQGQLELAKALLGQGRFVLAWRDLEELRKDFPDVHLVRANVLVNLHRSREAAEEFTHFLQEAPDDPRNEQIRQIVFQLSELGAVP